MNKAELIDQVARKVGQTKALVAEMVDAVLDGITYGLKTQGEVRIANFGNFGVTQTKARQGRNPRTGETIKIPASKRPKFSAGKALKEAVGGKKK